MLSIDTFKAILEQANLAPSVHNVQPARWRFIAKGEYGAIELYCDLSKRLVIGDPEGKDEMISLGTTFEGLSLALSERGLGLGTLNFSKDIRDGNLEKILEASIVPIKSKDPLALQVENRACFRGVFEAPSIAEKNLLTEELQGISSVSTITEIEDLNMIAELSDKANMFYMGNPMYFSELFSWLRLSPKHPNWNFDGLNADAMSLNFIERFFANIFLTPKIFKILVKMKVALGLISEAPQIKKSTGIVLILADVEQSPFEIGREFYRNWLRITELGFSACPISALADWEYSNKVLREKFNLPDSKMLVNALRVGIVPQKAKQAKRARRPVTDLIL